MKTIINRIRLFTVKEQAGHFYSYEVLIRLSDTVELFAHKKTSYGTFDSEKIAQYSEDVRWTGLLQKALGDKALILEEGLCGRTTAFDDETIPGANGSAALPAILEASRPLDSAIIMLGTNDCKCVFHAPSDDITAGLEKCLKRILEAVKPENILLISPLYMGEAALDFGCDNRSLAVSRELKPAFQALADQYGTAFLAASDVAEPCAVDGQHLTQQGHYALYEAVLKAISPMIATE